MLAIFSLPRAVAQNTHSRTAASLHVFRENKSDHSPFLMLQRQPRAKTANFTSESRKKKRPKEWKKPLGQVVFLDSGRIQCRLACLFLLPFFFTLSARPHQITGSKYVGRKTDPRSRIPNKGRRVSDKSDRLIFNQHHCRPCGLRIQRACFTFLLSLSFSLVGQLFWGK